jgi:hypothetical protein
MMPQRRPAGSPVQRSRQNRDKLPRLGSGSPLDSSAQASVIEPANTMPANAQSPRPRHSGPLTQSPHPRHSGLDPESSSAERRIPESDCSECAPQEVPLGRIASDLETRLPDSSPGLNHCEMTFIRRNDAPTHPCHSGARTQSPQPRHSGLDPESRDAERSAPQSATSKRRASDLETRLPDSSPGLNHCEMTFIRRNDAPTRPRHSAPRIQTLRGDVPDPESSQTPSFRRTPESSDEERHVPQSDRSECAPKKSRLQQAQSPLANRASQTPSSRHRHSGPRIQTLRRDVPDPESSQTPSFRRTPESSDAERRAPQSARSERRARNAKKPLLKTWLCIPYGQIPGCAARPRNDAPTYPAAGLQALNRKSGSQAIARPADAFTGIKSP